MKEAPNHYPGSGKCAVYRTAITKGKNTERRETAKEAGAPN